MLVGSLINYLCETIRKYSTVGQVSEALPVNQFVKFVYKVGSSYRYILVIGLGVTNYCRAEDNGLHCQSICRINAVIMSVSLLFVRTIVVVLGRFCITFDIVCRSLNGYDVRQCLERCSS